MPQVESIVLKRYGREACRIFKLLLQADRVVETEMISKDTFVDKKDVVTILHQMWKDDYLYMQVQYTSIQQHSESLLRKFIDSLSFSARLWVLLTISCFKKKFSGFLSEKDILGSKHQGVAQKYCTSCLPSSVVRSRHGIFTEYCKHDSCGCGSEPDCSHLKLEALPRTDQAPLIHEKKFINKMTLPEDSHGVDRPILNFMDSCSDIKVFLSPESLGFLEGSINFLGQGFVKAIVSFEELTNISESMTPSVQSLQTPDLDVFLPKGKLISLCGHVVAFHSTDHSSVAVNIDHNSSIGDFVPNFIKGKTLSACMHVLVENHMVKVFGNLSKHALPVGFGAGVNATFHRILITGRQNELLLLPASVIAISSALVVNSQYKGSCNLFSATLKFPNIPLKEVGPVSLISELDKCSDHMLLQLHCKIIAVYVLMLEKNRKAVHSHPITHIRISAVNIPLAGFILDDGSSLCCCWTNNEKALTLLQLDKEYDTTRESSRGSKKTFLTEPRNSNSVKLDKILQQYGRVVMRNHGSTSDSCFQDIVVSFGSNKFISRLDEEFLKLSILNACFRSTLWTVVGRAMDSNDTERLENQLTSLNMPNLPMRNIWGVDFNQSNPVTEARSILEELNMK